MARVCGSQFSGGYFQNAQPDGHEHFCLIVIAEQVVGFFQDSGRGAFLSCQIFEDPFGKHHEQGCRDALSAYICYDQT